MIPRFAIFSEKLKPNKSPLHEQLTTIIEQAIHNGTLQPGDLLPAEMEMCEWMGISRTTVRQAFSRLGEKGLIERIKGKGTFVALPKLNRSLNRLNSFSDEIRSMGLDSDSKVLAFSCIDTPKDVQECFDKPVKQVYKIVRMRTVNGIPLTIETVYLPVIMVDGLTKKMLDHSSLYDLLREQYGIVSARASETYNATTINEEQAEILKCPIGIGAFYVTRLSRDTNGRIFELANILVRGDRCRYEVELECDNVSFLSHIDKN